jgi:hypothetical protein
VLTGQLGLTILGIALGVVVAVSIDLATSSSWGMANRTLREREVDESIDQDDRPLNN